MDAEGARALAERIAAGKPAEDGKPAEASAPSKPPRGEEVSEPGPSEAAPASAVQIVHLEPEQAPRREVRTYVRGPNGELERRS